jgi:drug/metabolite transporter (DMT)-like permease
MKHGSVAAVTVYTLLGGMVLPFIYGVAALGEQPSLWRYIGTVILIVSILPPLFMNGKTGTGEKHSLRSRITYAVCVSLIFLTNGGVSVITTASQRDPSMATVGSTDFLLTTAILRAAVAVVLIACLSAKQRRAFVPTDIRTGKPVTVLVLGLLAGILLLYAACNGVGNVFNLECAKTMDASLQFPIISAACIVLSAVWALIFFREKPSKGDLISIALSIAGIALYMF